MKKLIRSIALLAALSAVITIGGGGATAAAKVSCVMLPSTVEYKNVLHMGPGGDFAGATVVREKVVRPAVVEILQPGPGGDFAGATVTRVVLDTLEAQDTLVMGPGGDFAGATVNLARPELVDVPQLTCG